MFPATGLFSSSRSRLTSFPSLRRISACPAEIVQIPAESYPRYSSRFSPSMITGVASPAPLYPTMPHILSPLLFKSPAFLVDLRGPGNRQRIGGDVLRHRRPGRHQGIPPDGHRRHQLHVASDEYVVADDRPVFPDAVVVA